MILSKQVGVYLNFAHNKFKQFVTLTFQKHGFNLTPEQFLLMDALWDNGTMSQQQIADNILKDKNSIVKLVDGLEKKNLVKRVADKQDRRQNLIELTPYAIEIKTNVTKAAIEAVTLITEDISDAELQQFIKVLTKMADNMQMAESKLTISNK